MKNKLLLFFVSFVLLSVYILVNSYFMKNSYATTMFSDSLYDELNDVLQNVINQKQISYSGYQVLGATTIERNVYDFFDQIIINRGHNDGINVGDLVVNNECLVGVVDDIYDNYSEIKLITNSDLKISVKINDSYAIYNNGMVNTIIDYSKISVGDQVYTSGLTNLPGNIYVGEVKELYPKSAEARVEVCNIKNLKFVYVITGDN